MPEIIVGYEGSDTAKASLGEAAALSKELGAGWSGVRVRALRLRGGDVPTQRDAVPELADDLGLVRAEHHEDRMGDAGRPLDVDRLGVGHLGAQAVGEVGRRLLARRQGEDEAPAPADLEALVA